MKGFLRAVEAAIAVMIMLLAFQFLYTLRFTFHPHETRNLSNISNSILQTYYSTIAHYVSQADLKTLESLFDSVLPSGFGYTLQLEYFLPMHTLFGSSGYRPLHTVADFSYSVDPGSVKIQDENSVTQDTQVMWKWYRLPFQIINNEEAKTYTSTVLFELDWQDTNNDGVKEPIDHSSLELFLDTTGYNYTLINITQNNQTDLVYLDLSTPLDEYEVANGFLYFKVIG
jgi:hypothetical protein